MADIYCSRLDFTGRRLMRSAPERQIRLLTTAAFRRKGTSHTAYSVLSTNDRTSIYRFPWPRCQICFSSLRYTTIPSTADERSLLRPTPLPSPPPNDGPRLFSTPHPTPQSPPCIDFRSYAGRRRFESVRVLYTGGLLRRSEACYCLLHRSFASVRGLLHRMSFASVRGLLHRRCFVSVRGLLHRRSFAPVTCTQEVFCISQTIC